MSKKNKSFQVSLEAEVVVNPLKMTKKEFMLSEIAKGYVDNSENNAGGVIAMSGRTNVRPHFQRSNVVANNIAWKSRLIHSVLNWRPIGIMYFGLVDDPNSQFEYIMIDGQQRVMTVCEFINGDFPITYYYDGQTKTGFFRDLPQYWQERILNYRIEVYVCEGSEHEQIKWFVTINQPSSILTTQELRNTAFSKYVWLESAKAYFSSPRANYRHEINDKKSKYCMSKYASFRDGANGDGTRQECLERAIEWICNEYPEYFGNEYTDPVEMYMINHCQDENADELINYYKDVVNWIHSTFLDLDEPVLYPSLKSVDWGRLYHEYHEQQFDTKYVSRRVAELLKNYGEMSNPAGVYEYVLRGEKEEDERLMSFRNFSPQDVINRYNEQRGCDPIDGKHYELSELHAHHIVAVENGGKRDYDNLVLLSAENHRKYAHGGTLNFKELKAIRDRWINENVPYLVTTR